MQSEVFRWRELNLKQRFAGVASGSASGANKQSRTMKNYNAGEESVERVHCAVCDKSIQGGKWFSRFKIQESMVALCCPLCNEAFTRSPAPYVKRIETLCGPSGVGNT